MGEYALCIEEGQDLMLRHSQHLNVGLRRLGSIETHRDQGMIIGEDWKITKEIRRVQRHDYKQRVLLEGRSNPFLLYLFANKIIFQLSYCCSKLISLHN